jgi:lipid A 3-O-deacylase
MSRIDRLLRLIASRSSHRLAGLVLAGLGLGRAVPVSAQGPEGDTAMIALSGAAPAPSQGIVSEIRAGVLAHDLPILGPQREHGADVNTELLFVSPVSENAVSGVAPAVRWLLRPRPQIGITQNFSGYTSQVYLGFDLTAVPAHDLLRSQDRFLVDLGFGGAINNDRTLTSGTKRLRLGSNVLFHPNLQIGYGIDPRYSVALFYEHSSNAHLAKVNEGLNNIGIRLGRSL